MVGCRTGLRGDYLSGYTNFFYELQAFEHHRDPYALYHVCVPCMSRAAHTYCKLLKKFKNTNLFQRIAKVCKFQRV
jgi:hypothetical protein